MQNRITKTCQMKKNKRADKLRDLLQLTPFDSILLDACARKPLSDVQILLEASPGANPDTIRDKYLRTPLHIACGRKDDFENATSIAKLLITAGSDINNGVGDVDGLQPLHMAVLAGNHQCVLMLLHEGATIPSADPFRLTPLLLAKLKLDNLRHAQQAIHNTDDDESQRMSESAKSQYDDLKSITQVLVSHLANKHITTFGLPSYDTSGYHGLSDFLFSKQSDEELSDTISSITDKLALIGMNDGEADEKIIQDSVNGLIEKVKKLGINEAINKHHDEL
ncbi:ankyrin repeat-containing domain protein [Parasitella parasitica]|nr:ankyrin repeat-containing domain protein [Parasitella parasitica]